MTEAQEPDVRKEKKSDFTWTDWLEGALMLVVAVMFLMWWLKK
ncbi:hypothetical protein ACGH2B_10265 [Streptomyces sp. BBFR2]